MKRLFLFLILILLTVPAAAQTYYTGHFSFEVPDSWKFDVMEDGSFVFGNLNNDYLLVLEDDMTEYGTVSPSVISGMYDQYKDRDLYTKTRINGDLVAYFVEDHGDGYSIVSYDGTFMYYKNQYLLYMVYVDSRSLGMEDCVDSLLSIAETSQYNVSEKSDYSLTPYYTDHFLYAYPRGWFHIEENGAHYYYGGTERSPEGGSYVVQEIPLSEFFPDTNIDVYDLYKQLAQGFYEASGAIGDMNEESIIINGSPAYRFSFLLDVYSGYSYSTLLIDDDYLLLTVYTDTDSFQDDYFCSNIVNTLSSELKPIYQ